MEDSAYSVEIGGGYRFGFIAQDVEQVIPEVVKTLPDSTKAVSYTDIIAILVEALKVQQNEINELHSILEINGLIRE